MGGLEFLPYNKDKVKEFIVNKEKEAKKGNKGGKKQKEEKK